MTITLNHTIIPASNKQISAEFFAKIFGLKIESPIGHEVDIVQLVLGN